MASDTKTESNRKLQRLVGQKYVLLDGGSATEMVRIGCKNIDNDPLWSARLLKTNPETVMQVHKNFLLAGSEVLDTASYQASVQGFVDHLGVDHDTALSLIGQSVVLAREACTETGCDAVVAGCVGPYGAVLHDGSEYTGAYAEKITREELKTWHRPSVEALLNHGADMLAVDTIPVQKEAEAIVDLLSDYPDARAMVCFSCKEACVTCDGERFSDAVRSVVQSDQVLAVGLNCTAPEHVCDLLESVQHLQLQKGVVVKPNSGEQWVRDEGWIPGSGCVSLGNQVKTWVDRGATWIGGCCRVYPDDIAKMKKELDRL
ncbi:homocysteine S-methyltransferase YbgG-like isoform X1 [Haliotis rubra]|uniref:homocysteine S-methyltransferase YbgG-like isoform X1 n=1 Tax=Haliotis rubra TaxID=36100 RepID=UPI001EE613E4|nr:homocysteine S-methyltransferase YbgG-like isoform X1 [Haliotis rubra]XP_046571785.1 homocysteine S-methyltransferase YbgG-like isoform X1 [Haliotis rubra]XP_046571786.1 homocysteine S-methyltransferase YbgG-like isoform X1 [Haliotis rubra]